MPSPLLAMREHFDPTVTVWPGVARRTMMGHPGYGVRGKLFAFFDEGQVIVKIPDGRRDELLAQPGTIAWVPPGSGMTRFGQWLGLTTADHSDDDLCDALEIAYRHVAESDG